MFKLNPFPTIKSFSLPFGLDISDLSLKLVSLNKKASLNIAKKNKPINLLSYDRATVPPGYFRDGEIIEKDKIVDIIKKLIRESNASKKISNYVVSVLPETKAFIKVIEIPTVIEEKIPNAINKEIKNHFPFSPDEIYLDWQRVTDDDPFEDKIKILTSISPKKIVDSYTELLLSAGLKPFALEIESSAICRALLPEEINPRAQQDDLREGTAIIDIGATRTSLIFYDLGTIQFTTSIPFSGRRITEKIAEKLKLTGKEAETAKIKCGLNDKKCQGILQKVLNEDIEKMITKIKNSLLFYQKHFDGNNPIKKIILCGGGANFKNIDSILEKKIGVKTELANPLINVGGNGVKFPQEEAMAYTTAIGLALRGVLIND